MPSLVVERGQEKGFTFDLPPGGGLVVGRDPVVDVVISDPAASRRHFQIQDRGGSWFIQDMGSRNGTFVDEDLVNGEISLHFGARIQVGETVFSFLEERAEKGKSGGLNGKVIGGYLILDRVGRGGMGTVYKARQISLNREVALKILSSRFARDPAFVEQFVAEARAAGQLNHPNVVQVFDVGQSGGLHYYAMEFMEAGAVQDLLAKQPESRLPWTEALPMILDAANGLVFAERRGIIHRDIKPDNLMLNAVGDVKIGDLGLAMRAEDEGDGRIFGTPHFVSPEQAQGKPLTHAADIYSLGASFYRMVTGKTPFAGTTVKEILRKQVNDLPAPVAGLVPDFPPDLVAILDRMMAKRVEDRYRSASELVTDLEAFMLEHQIELAGGRKNTKPLYFTLAAVLVALAGVIYWAVNREREKEYIKDTTTVFVNKEPVGPVQTPEQLREQEEIKARAAFFEIKADRDTGEPTREEAAKWRELADAYEALYGTWKDKAPRNSRLMKTRADEIRGSLTKLEEEHSAKITAATAWWTSCEEKVQALVDAGKWSEALALAAAELANPDNQAHMTLAPEAKTKLGKVEETVVAAVTAEWNRLETDATARVNSGDPQGSITDVSRWEQALRKQAGEVAALLAIADQAADWLTEQTEDRVARLTEELDADRYLMLDAYRAVRNFTDETCPVFDFRFADAAAALEQKVPQFRTWIYRDRAAAKVAALRQMGADWAAFVAALPGLYGPEELLKGVPGLQDDALATFHPDKPPTTDSFTVRIRIKGVPGASSQRSKRWAEMTPAQFWEVAVAPKRDQLPGPVALGLARIFVELGQGDAASACLRRTQETNTPFDAALETRLRSEITAWQEYEALKARVAEPGDPVMHMKAVDDWRKKHVGSDMFVLLDGRAGEDTPHLFPRVDVDEFLMRLGVKPH